jgi:hypothetical protein
MGHGFVGTNRHTMSTPDTQLIAAIHKGGKGVLIFKFNDSNRANFRTNTVTVTFFMIYG